MNATAAIATIGHNQPPADNDNSPEPTPYELIKTEIEDLYDEAKNFADGEPIATQEMHDAIEKLHEMLHDAGRRADDARKEEKKPLDEAAKEIQARYNPLIGDTKTTGKGKVILGKEALAALLLPWRTRVAAEKAAIAAAARIEADRIAAEAQAAIRASAGNLEEREKAELLLKDAKAADLGANRADKAATTGTGLSSRWVAVMTDEVAALDHYYPIATEAFRQLCEELARVDVQIGKRSIPGFEIREEKVVRV